MSTAAIIAEYNPFHLGHRYQFQKLRDHYHIDHILVLMSGNYVQRGEPALLEKHARAEAALRAGADLILELPVIFSTASSEYFARGALQILDQLQIADCLCFGTESDNLPELTKMAQILIEEPADFQTILKQSLKAGNNFPKARQLALSSYVSPDCAALLTHPNNILALEYLKAILLSKSRLKPLSIPRINADYHDTSYEKRFFSASALRALKNNPAQLAESLYKIDPSYDFTWPFLEFEDFSMILGEKILSVDELSKKSDLSPDLARRIRRLAPSYIGVTDFLNSLKTKNYTYTRISRALLHLMLGISDDVVSQALKKPLSYVKVLGFSEKGRSLLGKIDKRITLLLKNSDADKLSTDNRFFYEKNLSADALYRLVAMQKKKAILPPESQQKIRTTSSVSRSGV